MPQATAGHFADRLQAAIDRCRTAAIVGIDPVVERLPDELQPGDQRLISAALAVEQFGEDVLAQVAGVVPAVKINIAFFEAFYDVGLAAYYRLVAKAHEAGLLVIGDIKRGDIGSTAALYARGHLARPLFGDFDPRQIPDAVTLSGYLGVNSVRPFIEIAQQEGKGVYILVRPSDPGADQVHEISGDGGTRFYQHMASFVRDWGAAGLVGAGGLSCVGAVIAPKDAASTAALRAALPQTPFLVPGYGAQGASAESCRACFHPDGRGAVVNASRSVIFAYEDPRYTNAHGKDWRACIAHAARDFAAGIGALHSGTGASHR